jgi:hypothetical protein
VTTAIIAEVSSTQATNNHHRRCAWPCLANYHMHPKL